MLGVVQTAVGLPVAHRVWQGNVGETTTLKPVIEEVVGHAYVPSRCLETTFG